MPELEISPAPGVLRCEKFAKLKGDSMRVAIPTENNLVCPHFGHCEVFTIVEVDPATKTKGEFKTLNPPPHERGVIPAWLKQLGCTHIIAGGMGHRALALFQQYGIEVISGTPSISVEDAVNALIDGGLDTSANPCDDPAFRRHGEGRGECGGH
jgi:ATP-binding protein involved in chromosome partitioning